MFEIFNSKDAEEARDKFEQLGQWIEQTQYFYSLNKWWKNLDQGWNTWNVLFKTYF